MKKLLTRSTSTLAALAAVIALPVLAEPVSAQRHAAPATVSVVHGIRGQDLPLDVSASLPVDVTVNGDCLLRGFEFGSVAGPLSLPPGEYLIEIRLGDREHPCSQDPVIVAAVAFDAGEDATVVAHLDADGNPTATKFVNDASPLKAPLKAATGRLELRHAAAAPAVDIALGKLAPPSAEGILLPGVPNGAGASLDLKAGKYAAEVFVAGTDVSVLGPAGVSLKPKKTQRVYVVGSAANDTLTLIVETIG